MPLCVHPYWDSRKKTLPFVGSTVTLTGLVPPPG